MTLTPRVGDVWAVQTTGWAAALIRFGSRLRGRDSLDNHVVIVHHVDPAGVAWGIEGRPGGVGWADLRRYQQHPATRSNEAQPKTDGQRAQVAALAEQMLGTQYDWAGIGADAAADLGLPQLFASDWHGHGVPGHIVCSSFAAYVYGKLGLAHPDLGHERFCQPSDWTEFDQAHAWAAKTGAPA